jgi:hypothetical protein
MAVLAQLRKYELIVHTDLKLPSISRQQGDGLDLWLEFLQQLSR